MTKDYEEIATLTIVIVNWNTGDQLRDCVASINRTARRGYRLCEVVIVDNDSRDDSLHGLHELQVPVRVIENQQNRGFAAACNQGAAGCQSDYLLFLNPDTRLFEKSLELPICFMQDRRNAQIGVCGIRLVDAAGETSTSAARFPTLRVVAGSVLGLSRISPRAFPPHFLSASELQNEAIVDQVIGAFFLIRRHVFELCRGFDERFFVYYEEVDLSLRAMQSGYLSQFLPAATAFHKGGGSSERVKAARLFYSLRSRLQYGRKHYSTLALLALFALTILELPLRLARALARASLGDFINTLKAYWQLTTSARGRS